jgi:hypothetical protein
VGMGSARPPRLPLLLHRTGVATPSFPSARAQREENLRVYCFQYLVRETESLTETSCTFTGGKYSVCSTALWHLRGTAADQRNHGGRRQSGEERCLSWHLQDVYACPSARGRLNQGMRTDVMSELGLSLRLTLGP